MSSTNTHKATSAKKSLRPKITRRKKKEAPAAELSANDLMFKAWQRIYKNRHKRLD